MAGTRNSQVEIGHAPVETGPEGFEMRCVFEEFGDSLRGTIETDGNLVKFVGWMEFAAAIAVLAPENLLSASGHN